MTTQLFCKYIDFLLTKMLHKVLCKMIIIAATTVIISFDLLLVVDDRELTTKYHISVHVLL